MTKANHSSGDFPERQVASSHSTSGLKHTKKWEWNKPKGKPKRPPSAYNLFFRDFCKSFSHDRMDRQGCTPRNKTKKPNKMDMATEQWKRVKTDLKYRGMLSAYKAESARLLKHYKEVDLKEWKLQQQYKKNGEGAPQDPQEQLPKESLMVAVPYNNQALLDAANSAAVVEGSDEKSVFDQEEDILAWLLLEEDVDVLEPNTTSSRGNSIQKPMYGPRRVSENFESWTEANVHRSKEEPVFAATELSAWHFQVFERLVTDDESSERSESPSPIPFAYGTDSTILDATQSYGV